MSTIFNYKNFSITMTPNGKFVATVAGGVVKAPSLDGLKRKLDKLHVFKSFDAFRLGYHSEIQPVKIVGTTRKGRTIYWVNEHNRTYDHVIIDTPENRALADAWVALVDKNDKERDRMQDAEEAAKDALPKILPGDPQ